MCVCIRAHAAQTSESYSHDYSSRVGHANNHINIDDERRYVRRNRRAARTCIIYDDVLRSADRKIIVDELIVS